MKAIKHINPLASATPPIPSERPNGFSRPSLATLELERRQKLIGRELVKLYAAFDMDFIQEDLDARLALTMTDWAGIPTTHLRRTCARARRTSKFFPKPWEVYAAYRAVREARHKRLKAIESARIRSALPPPPMSKIQHDAIWRGLYAMAGMDYDIENMRRKALGKNLRQYRRS